MSHRHGPYEILNIPISEGMSKHLKVRPRREALVVVADSGLDVDNKEVLDVSNAG